MRWWIDFKKKEPVLPINVDYLVMLLEQRKDERLDLYLNYPSEDKGDVLEEIEDKIYRKYSQVKIFLNLASASILQRVSRWLSKGYQIYGLSYDSADEYVSPEILLTFLQGISTAETLKSLEYKPSSSCS